MGDLSVFLSGLGAYAPAFLLLTGATLWQMLEARRAAVELLAASEAALEHPHPSARAPLLRALGELDATTDRSGLLLQSGPTLALLGTCMGFYWALQRLGTADIGGDPLELLTLLMQSGVGSALATTVIGQALYLALGQVWASLLAGQSARARVLAQEALSLLRDVNVAPPRPRGSLVPRQGDEPGSPRAAIVEAQRDTDWSAA